MGRGEEKVLGVSSIKCAVQGLHCEVKSMDESSLVPRPLPPRGEGPGDDESVGHTEQLHDMDVPFTGAASLQAELIAEVSCTVRTSTWNKR